VIPFVIDIMNNVHSLPTNLPTDLPTELSTEIFLSVIPLVEMTRHHFFLLCFNFFFHSNSLGIYRGNISVGKIPRKFTDRNIPSVFPFVFIDFLVVICYATHHKTQANNNKKQSYYYYNCNYIRFKETITNIFFFPINISLLESIHLSLSNIILKLFLLNNKSDNKFSNVSNAIHC
jgi:hypothetical protein